MKKLLLILFLGLFSFTIINAQTQEGKTETRKNSVYFEALGKGGLGSLNYERKLLKNTNLSFSIGVGLIDANALTLPIALHYAVPVSKSKKGFLEIGVGYTFMEEGNNDFSNNEGYATFSTGYKRNFGNNWFWKANLTQLIIKENYYNNDYNLKMLPSVGISIGKYF